MDAELLKFVDLEPRWVRWERERGKVYLPGVETIELAHGVMFLCPKCFSDNRGPVGTHSVICWSSSAGAPDEATPGPGRWKMDGTGFDDLSLNGESGKSRSVALKGGCAWHGYVTNGMVTDA